MENSLVATVLTVYGIETTVVVITTSLGMRLLQQYLPFTVLKHVDVSYVVHVPN